MWINKHPLVPRAGQDWNHYFFLGPENMLRLFDLRSPLYFQEVNVSKIRAINACYRLGLKLTLIGWRLQNQVVK